ncbi:AMP-dependent synthetase/ligase [Brevibacterium sp. FAM 24638]|nr:long-chain fatty acid--CoA ligase [Brevibacterium sp. S22]
MSTERPSSAVIATRLAEAQTMCDVLLWGVADNPDHIALRSHEFGTEWTYAQAHARIGEVAARLQSMGVGRGDVVALMMRNLPEFHVIDAAAMLIGAVPFSVYNTSSPDQVEFLLSDAGADIVVAESLFVPVVRQAQALGNSNTQLVSIDAPVDGCAELSRELAREETTFDFACAAEVRPDELLTLIYTSGTMGPPKGVELTHASMLAQLRSVHASMPLPGGGRQLSFLPAAHVADRWSSHYSAFMSYGNTLVTVADAANLAKALAATRPTIFGAPPRVWEKLKAAVEASYPGEGLTQDAAATPVVATGVREKLGLDDAQWLITGAAPTPSAVVDFFTKLGLPVCEVLGMSEASGCPAGNTPDSFRPGSVGRPFENVEVKLDTDGELLLRSPQVMRGYRGLPERTDETVDRDGWLHTGDIARIDEEGFIWIVDRKKELIISAGGKNMSPANIELAMRSAGSLIDHVCVIGDGRPYNVALVVVEPAASAGRTSDDSGLVELVRAQIGRANETLSRVEQIKKFKILAEDWSPGEQLTPTMKLRRAVIAERYAREIESLYEKD